MAKNEDVFGFDELSKAFHKLGHKYPNEADALLMAQGQAVNKQTKAQTPIGKTKKLKGSWRLKKVKAYQGGKVRVVRVQSTAPHAHLVEQGHEIVRGGKTRAGGRKLNYVQRSVRGIKSGGRVEGKKMLEKSIKEAKTRFYKETEKMLDKLTKEVQI
jgi:hypothetical protein